MKLSLFFALLLAAMTASADSARVLSADEWARPRDGQSLTQFEAVAGAVRDFMATPDGRLVIRYPGGEEGVLWAQELRAWLVALGVSSARIETRPGSQRIDSVDLLVSQDGDLQP